MKTLMTAMALVLLAGGTACAQDAPEREDKADHWQSAEQPQRHERAERQERSERAERPERAERRDFVERDGGERRRTEAPTAPEAPRAPEARPAPAAGPSWGGGGWERRGDPDRQDRRERPNGEPWRRPQGGDPVDRADRPQRPSPQTEGAGATPRVERPERVRPDERREQNGQARDERRDNDRRAWDRREGDRRDGDRNGGDRRWDGDRGADNHRQEDWNRRWSQDDRRRWEDHDRDRDRRRGGYNVWRPGFRPFIYDSQRRYRVSIWIAPPGYYARSWRDGDFLPFDWYGPRYRVMDWWIYDLPWPPAGYDWIRVGEDALLVDRWTGRIVQVVRFVFW